MSAHIAATDEISFHRAHDLYSVIRNLTRDGDWCANMEIYIRLAVL